MALSLTAAKALTFVTTYKCGARCKHCLMECVASDYERLSLRDMQAVIEWFADETKGKVVIFTGGECTYLGDDLLEAIAYACSRGLSTRIVTNAEWAISENLSREMVTALSDAGLEELNISYDDFHGEWIPFDNIKFAWDSSKYANFSTVVLASCRSAGSKITFRTLTRDLGVDLELSDSGNTLVPVTGTLPNRNTKYYFSKMNLYRLGRAHRLTQDTYIEQEYYDSYSVCPDCATDVVVSPNRTLSMCCGINHRQDSLLTLQSIDELVSKSIGPDTRLHEIIANLGPQYVLKFVEEEIGLFSQKPSYFTTPCEICELLSSSKIASSYIKENIDSLYEAYELECCLDTAIKDALKEQ